MWIDGEKFEAGKTRTKLVPGTEVKFFDKTYKGAEYKELSEDSLIHQAVAVWTGERPEHLLKKIQEEEYKKKLEEHRKSFMLYLRGEVFLRAALVRVKCEIAGYLSDNMGIAEHKDENDKKINIFFHTDDVKVFKKDIREYGKPAKQILPVRQSKHFYNSLNKLFLRWDVWFLLTPAEFTLVASRMLNTRF